MVFAFFALARRRRPLIFRPSAKGRGGACPVLKRTGENGHRAIYHRTLGRSEPVGSGEDREAVARVAAELQQATRGPPEPGCDRADEFRGIAGPEPESRAQRRAWALAQIGGGAVSGRVSGAHTEGSAGVRRLRERARRGLKSAATQLQASVSAASERSVSTIYRRPVPVVPAKQQRVTASSRGARGSRAKPAAAHRAAPPKRELQQSKASRSFAAQSVQRAAAAKGS